jgi:hypothetical protein
MVRNLGLRHGAHPRARQAVTIGKVLTVGHVRVRRDEIGHDRR